MSDFKPISERVRQLKQEALRNDPYTFKDRGRWIKNKILACDGDERSLEELRELLKRLPWSYPPQAVDVFLEHIKLDAKLSREFNAVQIGSPIEQAKKRWPIKTYCQEIVGLQFKHNKCKCPLHAGDSETSFVVDEKHDKWFCFGKCPHPPGTNHRKGDVVDLHLLLNGFQNEMEAVKDLLSAKPKVPQDVALGQHSFFSSKAEPEKSEADAKQIAKVLPGV